ncbi:hypothetical protein EYF80_045513 [Liparis tanakae]|uniref:Uncharacterized protein n=1 Tax=Liparis tanakae TaxID=230148 RepID=A0A4Z2FSY7_9TELE|nr:hypothetical protein EYF80_045513 [Liparis tanakae]
MEGRDGNERQRRCINVVRMWQMIFEVSRRTGRKMSGGETKRWRERRKKRGRVGQEKYCASGSVANMEIKDGGRMNCPRRTRPPDELPRAGGTVAVLKVLQWREAEQQEEFLFESTVKASRRRMINRVWRLQQKHGNRNCRQLRLHAGKV